MDQPTMAHLEVTHPGPEFDVLQRKILLQALIHLERGTTYKALADTES